MHYRKRAGLDRRFWSMWGAVATSSLGVGILAVAFPLLALQFTHNPLAISSVAVAAQAPGLIIALPFGTIADRVNRRRLILWLQAVRIAILAAFGLLVLFRHDGLPLIYATVFLLGGLTIAFDVTANACLPSIVPDDQLVKANAHLLNVELTSEQLLGQALGGAALAVNASVPFLAEAGSLVVSAALLKGAVPDTRPEPTETAVWDDLRTGLRWFVKHPYLRVQAAVMGSLSFGQGMVVGLLALYARGTLHLSNPGYGLLLAVASIGTIGGGLLGARLDSRLNSGLALIAAALVMAAGYPVLAMTHSAIVAAGALILEETGVIVASTASRSSRQRLVPDEMQARVLSVFWVILMASVPLGALAGGLLARATSVQTVFLCAGLAGFALVALFGPGLYRAGTALSRTPPTKVVDVTVRSADREDAGGTPVTGSVQAV